MSGTTTPTTYEFDPVTQAEIVTCMVRDDDFLRQTDGLIKPEYFIGELDRFFAAGALRHFEKYGESLTLPALVEYVREEKNAGRLRADLANDARAKIVEFNKTASVRSRAWLTGKIAEFAKQQAIANAMVRSIPLLQKGGDPDRFTKLEGFLSEAFKVGLQTNDDDYDYFERIDERTKERLDIAAGGKPKTGIPTGVKELDERLYHGGWGRKELSALIGGAKASKSFHLAFFAAKAVEAGKNTLFITLENSVEITATRIDAYYSGVAISEQFTSPNSMEAGVKSAASNPGRGALRIRRRPAGTFTPKDLRRLLDEYKTKGLKFDFVVVDYTDIMTPSYRTDNAIENSKSVLVDVRQIADDEDIAILTAFQVNREGHKSAVVRADSVSEDFNKVRISDLVLAISRTDDEKAEGKARLTFAAARNQTDGITLFVKQNLDLGRAIETVESVE